MKAGAYYFDGWSSKETLHISKRLMAEFSDRMPVWGWASDTVEIMEKQISLASSNNISFFAFDWYYPEGENKHCDLNNALSLFNQASNSELLNFCLLVANHIPYRIFKKDWNDVLDIWMTLFKKSTYLRVDGKPLLIIFLPEALTYGMGGSEGVKEAFTRLQERARDEGFDGVCIAACENEMPTYPPKAMELLQTRQYEGYTFFTGYNYTSHYFAQGRGRLIHSYKELADDHKDLFWSVFSSADSPLPYLPLVTCGFDKRPWEDPNDPKSWAWYYPDRTPEQVAKLILEAKEWMVSHPEKTSKEQILLLYAWNEMGEGGYILPTTGDGGRYLDVIGKAVLENL